MWTAKTLIRLGGFCHEVAHIVALPGDLFFTQADCQHNDIWATSWQNLKSGMCAQRRLRSAWASALIRVFAVCMKKAWVLSYPMSAQWRLWSDWADATADLSLCWAHMPFCWFCHEAAHFEFILQNFLSGNSNVCCSIRQPIKFIDYWLFHGGSSVVQFSVSPPYRISVLNFYYAVLPVISCILIIILWGERATVHLISTHTRRSHNFFVVKIF